MTALAALAVAQERRQAIADLRRRAHRGEITLGEILADPPEEILNWACTDVLRMSWASGRQNNASLERLGRLAIRDGINLLMPLGRTSLRTRSWIAEHAAWHHRSTRHVIVVVKDPT